MESDSLLGAARSTVSKVVIVVFLIIVVSITAISIAAIVLSVRAINLAESNQTNADNMNKCNYGESSAIPDPTYAATAPYNSIVTLIKNATIWTGTASGTLAGYDILIQGGIIHEIAQSIDGAAYNATVYDVNGAFVTPGLVDMHSHVGVYAFPEDSFGTSDGNELTNPTTPQVRAIDAFDPEDPAIPLILSGGVTTSLVLPGSGNVIGGEALLVKMKGGTVANMLIQPAPRLFKMAAGENPKRVYGSEGQLPMTRMGNIWSMRQIFAQARELRQQQEQWDCVAGTGNLQAAARPYNAQLEPLVAILSGTARLMVHCYEIQDFEAILRAADEFGVKVSAFHHALEAWKIAEVFAERNITLAIFSDSWGFKMEGFDGSVYGAARLIAAGASVAFKSDHAVIYAKYLMHEAAKGFHYGVAADNALRAVTVVPATSVGLIERIGTIEVGKDGDVVVWDRHALALGATPLKIFIEGIPFQNNEPNTTTHSAATPIQSVTPLQPTPVTACSGVPLASYTIEQATVYTLTGGVGPIMNANIAVVNGLIQCVGLPATCPAQGALFTVAGGVVIPGIISAASAVGLMEVESEENSQDGSANVDNGASIYASDGIRIQTRHISAAWKGGVTVQLATPQGNGLIAGVSSAFYTSPTMNVPSDALLTHATALHINIGNYAKISGATRSISQQFATLRSIFRTSLAQPSGLDPVYLGLNGTLPIVFNVNQGDEIDAVLRLKTEFNIPKIVISGGAESGVVAARLSSQGVGVILSPLRRAPGVFETLRASTNTPGVLAAAGVTVAVSMDDPAIVRNLRWEAGYAIEGGLTYIQALESVTSTVAQLLGLPAGTGTITQNTQANFVLYNGDPLTITSHISLVALGQFVDCNPQQY
jgi:imidazolonepropionase-like amidohydrolase